jgi:hypothetical protein
MAGKTQVGETGRRRLLRHLPGSIFTVAKSRMGMEISFDSPHFILSAL